jgi:hypothetical protein
VRAFLYEHGLSVALAVIYVGFKGGSWFVGPEQEFLYPTLHGHSDDTLGALLIVLCTKWWRERGSAASK